MVEERFWQKVMPEPNSGCWLWVGALYQGGYGALGLNGKTVRAHRVTYEAMKGPIPEGLHIDHKCKVRCCVNPDHLEAVTQAENNRRSVNRNRLKTHCPRGHVYDEANTKVLKSGSRSCRACAVEYRLEHHAEHKAYMKQYHATTHTRIR